MIQTRTEVTILPLVYNAHAPPAVKPATGRKKSEFHNVVCVLKESPSIYFGYTNCILASQDNVMGGFIERYKKKTKKTKAFTFVH